MEKQKHLERYPHLDGDSPQNVFIDKYLLGNTIKKVLD